MVAHQPLLKNVIGRFKILDFIKKVLQLAQCLYIYTITTYCYCTHTDVTQYCNVTFKLVTHRQETCANNLLPRLASNSDYNNKH